MGPNHFGSIVLADFKLIFILTTTLLSHKIAELKRIVKEADNPVICIIKLREVY